MNIVEIFTIMIVLFSIILLGYSINKLKILDEKTNNKLSELILKLTTPALIINSALGQSPSISRKEIITILLLGIGLYLFLIMFARLIVTVFQMKDENSGIYQLMIIIANTGFIGYPVLSALYGNSSIFPFSILHIPFNIVLFSYGIYITQKGKENIKFDIKSAVNPCVIAALISLLIFLLEIRVPEIFNRIFGLIGETTIPLSMLLIGSFLASINIKDIFIDFKIYIISIIKLLVLPFIMYFLSKLFIDNNLIIAYLTLSGALPTGPSIMIMVNQYSQNEDKAAVGVFITTILSIVTIPLIIYFLLV